MPSPSTLLVNERFVSLQGEGLLVGTPSTFIRVAGCNLRCAWCDSPATSWEPRGEPQAIDELVAYCGDGPRHVVLTGGEPLLFAGIATLSTRLLAEGHHVTVETAGTVWLDGLRCDLASISPKLAHSAPHDRDPIWAARHESRRRAPEVVRRIMDTQPWQLKLVVRATSLELLEADVAEVEDLVAELGLDDRDRDRVLLMPECTDPNRLTRDYAMLTPVCQRTGFRLGERLHISIFGHTPGT